MPFMQLVVSGRPQPILAKALAQGVTELTASILGKNANLTGVAVSFLAPESWFVSGQSLEELGLSSFWLDLTVSSDTSTRREKERYIAAVFALLRERLGPLHEASYVLVHDVPADSWGFAGLSQADRKQRVQPAPG
jgi:4-oxalocrotonate tautomerase